MRPPYEFKESKVRPREPRTPNRPRSVGTPSAGGAVPEPWRVYGLVEAPLPVDPPLNSLLRRIDNDVAAQEVQIAEERIHRSGAVLREVRRPPRERLVRPEEERRAH